MKVKQKSEKVGLKLNIQKTLKITVSGSITSWQIDGETAGVQPRQDPGGTLRMNGVAEGRHVRPALMGPSLRGREREREKEWPDGGCSRGSQIFIFYRSFYILN